MSDITRSHHLVTQCCPTPGATYNEQLWPLVSCFCLYNSGQLDDNVAMGWKKSMPTSMLFTKDYFGHGIWLVGDFVVRQSGVRIHVKYGFWYENTIYIQSLSKFTSAFVCELILDNRSWSCDRYWFHLFIRSSPTKYILKVTLTQLNMNLTSVC